MKHRKKDFDIFNLSFLDVISCSFGAVVMLILISKTDVSETISGQEDISRLLASLLNLENSVTDIQQEISAKQSAVENLSANNVALVQAAANIDNQLQALQTDSADLEASIAGLSLVEQRLQQAALPTPQRDNIVRSEEVGGIPVDSDYVIFVIDTSGSMRQIWPRVSAEVINVLNIHPEVKGFQILNDMGTPLISGYDGRWMSDTPITRRNAIQMIGNWAALSNSSPVEGIEVALRRYAKPNITTSIYVFGDDYTGSSYDPVIDRITQLNRPLSSGRRLARIHGVGFISQGTTNRYSILMRELTQQNEGTFIALAP